MRNSQTILLTGGTGMVGRNILEHPYSSYYHFVAPSREQLDLTDYIKTLKYLNELSPDMIIHTAGLVGGIQANIEEPLRFLTQNLDIGRNLILAANEMGIKKILNLGSSCMYPREALNPLTENLILSGWLEPTNEGYALAKIIVMKLCEYISSGDTERMYKTMIPCNLYGKYDKFEPENSHLIPAIINKIQNAIDKGEDTIEIWGDGKARREFMYAGDFADAVIYGIENYETMPNIINIGCGKDYSIKNYYDVAAEVLGYSGKFRNNLSKPIGMKQKLVSNELQLKWGWIPQTSLIDGINETYTYYKESRFK
jgi:GDP-L-fucose synthase